MVWLTAREESCGERVKSDDDEKMVLCHVKPNDLMPSHYLQDSGTQLLLLG